MTRIILPLIILLGFHATAQTNKKLDSLLSVNQRYVKEDTVKIRMLLDLAKAYEDVKLESALQKAEEAVALSKRINSPLGLANAYAEQAAMLMFLSKYDTSISIYNQALELYTTLGKTRERIKMANNLGNVYYLSQEFKKAKIFYEKASKEAEEIGDKSTQAKALCNMGNTCNHMAEYTQAIQFYERGIRLFEQIGDKKYVARNTGNLGNCYQYLGDFKRALEYYFKARKVNEDMGYKLDLGNNLLNIGAIYNSLKDYDNDLKYTKAAFAIFEAIGNKKNMVAALGNIGGTYYGLGDFKKANTYHSRVLELGEEMKDNFHIISGLVSLLGNYGELKEYSKAFEYHKKLKVFDYESLLPLKKMSIAISVAYLLRISPDSVLKANGYNPQNKYDIAEESLKTALGIARELKNKEEEAKKLNEFSLLYEQKGDFKKAYDAFKQVTEINKQLEAEDLKKQILRKEVEYEFDKKESELIFQQKLTTEQLEKQRLLTTQREQELTLNNQQLRLKTQALALSNKEKAIQRLAYLKEKAEKQEKEQQLRLTEKGKQLQASQLVTLVKEKALQIQTLAKKNALIALLIASLVSLLVSAFAIYLWQRQKTLKQDKANTMNFTKQLLESTEEERKRIASDLHDSISHELLDLKHILKQDSTTINTKIDSIINDIRGISRNLHPVMFDKIGLEPNIEQLVERIQLQNNFMVSSEINYKGSLSSADELQVYRIIQEALTNIIKYAQAHAGKITMEENKERIFIEIKDNGKGFNVKEALNSGKSFGLHNIIERSRVIGGEAKIVSSEEGTIITINIPKIINT
jgi:signal transduction histidine kinase